MDTATPEIMVRPTSPSSPGSSLPFATLGVAALLVVAASSLTYRPASVDPRLFRLAGAPASQGEPQAARRQATARRETIMPLGLTDGPLEKEALRAERLPASTLALVVTESENAEGAASAVQPADRLVPPVRGGSPIFAAAREPERQASPASFASASLQAGAGAPSHRVQPQLPQPPESGRTAQSAGAAPSAPAVPKYEGAKAHDFEQVRQEWAALAATR